MNRLHRVNRRRNAFYACVIISAILMVLSLFVGTFFWMFGNHLVGGILFGVCGLSMFGCIIFVALWGQAVRDGDYIIASRRWF